MPIASRNDPAEMRVVVPQLRPALSCGREQQPASCPHGLLFRGFLVEFRPTRNGDPCCLGARKWQQGTEGAPRQYHRGTKVPEPLVTYSSPST